MIASPLKLLPASTAPAVRMDGPQSGPAPAAVRMDIAAFVGRVASGARVEMGR